MSLNDIGYLLLRLLRKYLFSERFLSHYGKLIPYYTVTSGQFSPKPIVKKYLDFSVSEDLEIKNKNILEVGVGKTNSTCYELALYGAKLCYAYEPYAQFDKELDNKIILKFPEYGNILNKVTRIKDLNLISPETADIVFSNSVLEHAENMDELSRHLKRIMKKNAWMIHIVDYRDHFFKYQFHFYKFSRDGWQRINPGLSRLRISDHIRILNDCGFETKVLAKTIAMNDFAKFKARNKIHREFNHYSDTDLATIMAVILSKKK